MWIVINGRLWRCAPSQLRRASERERHAATEDDTYPWTFNKIVRALNQTRQFTDVVDEGEPHGESVELEHQDGVEFREEDDEQRRFEEEIMEDMLPGADTKDINARSSSQVPEEPSEEEAWTLSRRMVENLKREQKIDAQSRKMRRITIPTITEVDKYREAGDTAGHSSSSGAIISISIFLTFHLRFVNQKILRASVFCTVAKD